MSKLNTAVSSSSHDTLSFVPNALKAIDNIAPSWPLDQMIAVNPYWQLRDKPFKQVSAYLGALDNVQCVWGEQEYLTRFHSGQITPEALTIAAKEEGVFLYKDELVAGLQSDRAPPKHWRNMSDLLDCYRSEQQMSWHEAIIHQISQFCAAHYQDQQPLLQKANKQVSTHLYTHWLSNISQDRGLSILMSEASLTEQFARLPNNEYALIEYAVAELKLDPSVIDSYFHGLLLDINGWASYVAYLRWQQGLHATDDRQSADDGVSLLAIRLAWELVLYWNTQQQYPKAFKSLAEEWQTEQEQFPQKIAAHQKYQQLLWVWARALEISDQTRLQNKLLSNVPPHANQAEHALPSVQAIFCIDVRSEVMRRALEAQNASIETYGFAGFFGLPIAYQPKDTVLSRPQLPGLLAPTITAKEKTDNASTLGNIQQEARWQYWGQSANSGFSLVESAGWLYGLKMLKRTFFPHAEENPLNELSHHTQWELHRDGQLLSLNDKAELCKGILSVMAIEHFADTVLLVGHGSHTANNPHAAGLDCGACGGQTGEVNVRVLAQLLNDTQIRQQLAEMEVIIPEATTFVAALHNTTTDHINTFDASLNDDISRWLKQATVQAQQERAQQIDPQWQMLSSTARAQKYQQQSHDWSQTRPEWGLANNNAFIIAPRSWTKGLDLQGRVFLHDYQSHLDKERGALELLMTAPMIVTNWINMQYHASTTDNHKYGSGNKVLHNVVGGNLGVFEGNGGDLRIGLSTQSLHDGQQWMHTPQRLCVYIAAPQEAIHDIIDRHPMLQELVSNEWLYVFHWDQKSGIKPIRPSS